MTKYIEETVPASESLRRKKGILVISLGSPDKPEPKEVRRFIKEFLSDFRVVDIPAWRWQPILRAFVLPFRPRLSARRYRDVWDPEKGSPQTFLAQSAAARLKARLKAEGFDIPVAACMTYGSNSVAQALAQMKAEKVTDLLAISATPQYASCSTGAAMDALWRAMLRAFNQPNLTTIGYFWDNLVWQNAVAGKIKRRWQERGRAPRHLIFSLHGLPVSQKNRGDVYTAQCEASCAALAERLGLEKGRWTLTYQSKFGPMPWVGPSTQETCVKLGSERLDGLDVVCPGFLADCLETLEEINQECRGLFVGAGGANFDYIPCLNDDDALIDALRDVARGFTG